ncbi:MAG TPA: DUF1206 domain-containing protein [Solirubrobacteraceae bacterium]|nr:DUF1206 domain-containing protein [Solirubrobacteraceae bacterium]
MKLALGSRTVLSRDASAEASRTVERLGRCGLVARGVVYGVIGALSIGLAIGAGGRTESQTGALRTIAHQPLGTAALVLVAIGLAGYALWRLLEAARGVDSGKPASAGKRASALGSGVAYSALCAIAVEILAGSRPSGGGARTAAAGVLGWPGGPVYVAVAGVLLLGAGLYQGYQGIARTFLEDSEVGRMSPETRRSFTALGVAGHVARGVIFLLIGYGVLRAALDYSPRRAVGLDGALQELVHASYGPILLGVVAAGFICFALYSIADARYHRI